MLERITEQKEAVWVSLASLKTDITPLTPGQFEIIEEILRVLALLLFTKPQENSLRKKESWGQRLFH